MDLLNFIRDNWDKIILVATTALTIFQEFREHVLKKR